MRYGEAGSAASLTRYGLATVESKDFGLYFKN